MTTHEAHARLQELHTAFDELTRTNPGLSVLPRSVPAHSESPDVFTILLMGAGSPEVRLRVRTHAAALTASSGSDHQSAGNGEIRDDLGVELESGFAWDDSICASADELARLLLKHMRRRLKAVGEVTPHG